MFLNSILYSLQNFFKPLYEKSYFLKIIDLFIGLCIFLVIFSSTFANSDFIGYFAIFAIMLTIVKLVTKSGEKFEFSVADKFLLVYFLFVLISVAGSTLFYLSLKGFFKTLTYLGYYVVLLHYLKENRNHIKYIFIAYALCLTFESLVAFLQNFSSVGEIAGWQDTSRLNPEEIMTRVYGTLKPYNPNLFGGYLLALLPVFIALPKFLRIWSISGFLMTTFAIVMTGCRGAYIGLFFELLLLAVIVYIKLKPYYRKIFMVISGMIACLVTFFILSVSALRARIFSIFAMRGDSSNSFRFNVYNSCFNMFKDNWLLGIGVGNQNFREIYGLYMKTGFDALSAYNIYLEIAVESGIFALIAFIGFIIFLVKGALKNINSIYVICALISLTGILVHGIVDTVFFRPQIQFAFWTMAAILRSENGCREN